MWVSSTEPEWLTALASRVSTFPERYGVDILYKTPSGFAGIQRKEIKDLIASVGDGRLTKELGQMAQLRMAILLIEGTPQWTRDGMLANGSSYGESWSWRQWQGLKWSVQDMGIWVDIVPTAGILTRYVKDFELWLEREHRSLLQRPKARGMWGKPDSREFGIHVLQSFDGVGSEMAGRIYDAFGLPLRWTVDEQDLQSIKGIGQKKADSIIGALHPRQGVE